MIRSADLQGAAVRHEDGARLGRVSEIHVQNGEVTLLIVGPGGLMQRFAASRSGRRVRWAQVQRITGREIVVR
jgi:sporulation protein YlmC with PRC-barrel domain